MFDFHGARCACVQHRAKTEGSKPKRPVCVPIPAQMGAGAFFGALAFMGLGSGGAGLSWGCQLFPVGRGEGGSLRLRWPKKRLTP